VAAGKAEAVAAGIQILKQGGNAADAAAATLLALAVTDYGSFSIGGEVPLLIYRADRQEVKVLCGVGRAPLDPQAIGWFYANRIPSKGSMKAAPVPGAVDLCVTLLKLHGTRSLEQVMAPTLALLDAGGRDWHPRLAITLRKLLDAERKKVGSREEKLAAARDRFYLGDVADELEAWYVATGAFLRKQDLAAQRVIVEEPVAVDYRGYTVYKCGPWTQGPALCEALGLLEGFDLKGLRHLSADYIHAVTEALKLALADRDEYFGDPLFVDVPLKTLLSKPYTVVRRPLIDMARASLERRPGDPFVMKPLRTKADAAGRPSAILVQDTTTCVVADRWGNVVAATPSCNMLTNRPGPSGVNQGNRVRCLNTMPGHPNRVEPGKRPRVTLTPTLVCKDGKPILAISVAGGDLQDQTTLNVLLNHIEFGLLPEQAVVAPRFSTEHHENSFDPNPNRSAAFLAAGSLHLSAGIPRDVQAELARRGHKLTMISRPIAHPVMIYLDPKTGLIHAAGDPRAGRHAAAIK
jgi:gamma-glutamyltranspeptidase/glutathione hydrolase